MKKIKINTLRIAAVTASFLIFPISIISSCSSTNQLVSSKSGAQLASTNQLVSSKSGAQLWGENCIRCHNTPSPETFSDTEWEVAITHMRVRANLTEEEAEKIVEFLKTAN